GSKVGAHFPRRHLLAAVGRWRDVAFLREVANDYEALRIVACWVIVAVVGEIVVLVACRNYDGDPHVERLLDEALLLGTRDWSTATDVDEVNLNIYGPLDGSDFVLEILTSRITLRIVT